MRRDVTNYVRTCDPCQKIKHDRGAGMGYLQPLAILGKPFDTISLDFITGLPLSNGKDAILVLVDKLTKFAHFIATTSKINAEHCRFDIQACGQGVQTPRSHHRGQRSQMD